MTNGPEGCEPGKGDRLAVVVASIDARATAVRSLSRFAEEVRGRGEVVLVDSSSDGTAGEVARDLPSVRLIRRPSGMLAPELWRVGLDATDAPFVAFSTAAMVPATGWLDAMLGRLKVSGAAAVGGPIEPAEGLATIDRAVYLLRYVNYLGPLPDTTEPEPPGDNSLYRRDRLKGLEEAIAQGFWETEIHRHLRGRGESLVMSAEGAVTFQGGSRLAPMLHQRFRHARHYGAMRASGFHTVGRLARAAMAPAVPVVLLKRSAATLRGRGRSFGAWLPALPGLSLLLGAWAAGEAFGLLAGPAKLGLVGRYGFAPGRKRAGEGGS